MLYYTNLATARQRLMNLLSLYVVCSEYGGFYCRVCLILAQYMSYPYFHLCSQADSLGKCLCKHCCVFVIILVFSVVFPSFSTAVYCVWPWAKCLKIEINCDSICMSDRMRRVKLQSAPRPYFPQFPHFTLYA